MTDDPVARLKAGLDAEHWEACKFHRDSQWSAEMLAGLFRLHVSDPVVHHVARYDPARALREIAAKREILAWYADSVDASKLFREKLGTGTHMATAAESYLNVIRAMAAVYGDDEGGPGDR